MSGNRKARRAAEARNRKRARNLACHNAFYKRYVQHLPQIPIDAPVERGRVQYIAYHHDHWCEFYTTNDITDCNCSSIVTRYVDPVRS